MYATYKLTYTCIQYPHHGVSFPTLPPVSAIVHTKAVTPAQAFVSHHGLIEREIEIQGDDTVILYKNPYHIGKVVRITVYCNMKLEEQSA